MTGVTGPVAQAAADRTGGHAVAEQLAACGGRIAFCVPGESYLALLDGLFDFQDQVRVITARQEGGAAMMAAAYGRLTGQPGICMVTRGPGATNASIGLHIASQDAVPLVLLIGQVPSTQLGRRAFQEIDYQRMFEPLSKAVIEVNAADRAPEAIARAYQLSTAGECGPVVVVLPEDVLAQQTAVATLAASQPAQYPPARDLVGRFQNELTRAERPMVVVGGAGWTEGARLDLQRFAEANNIPVATAFRQQDVIDNRSTAYVGALGLFGTPGLDRAVESSDVVALLGTPPDAITSRNSTLFDGRRQRVLHVHPDPEVHNRIYPVHLSIVSPPATFAAALTTTSDTPAPSDWLSGLRVRFLSAPGTNPVAREFMKVLNTHLPADCIMTCGAGTYTEWPQRYHQYTTYPSQLAPQAGSMGYGLPAAIAAKLVHPEREVVAFAGDGCVLMTGQELATAVKYHLGILVIVINNSSYGTIRNHQRARFPGRPIGTQLVNPDFAKWAQSFGATGERVSSPDEFAGALERSAMPGRPRLIEIALDE